ncbi:MAG: hypothetical protein J6V53_06595 [Alphaproteobacteria bacterium]|nr:hypothetical protein [Alphaproteobacteria bacterium]
MKYFFSKTLLLACCFFSVLSYAKEYPSIDCEKLLEDLETGKIQDTSNYDKCGFANEEFVWSKWAGYVSEKKMKRAIHEICVRYPDHEYHDLYCEKAILLGHPAAYILKGRKLIEKDDFQGGYEYLTKALATNALTQEEEAQVLEILGFYYMRTNNSKAFSYLDAAAKKGSAVAHNILAYNFFLKKDESLGNEEAALDHFWQAILIGCKTAEENYGLMQLAKQGKITSQKAEAEMRKNIKSCTPISAQKRFADNKLYNCRCAFSLEQEKRLNQKPYLLLKTEAKMAVLKDTQTGDEISVTEQRNLPNGANVLEVRKTAVILRYPGDVREILNLYKKDECVDFCKTNHITNNLSAEEMRLKIEGAKETVRIKPYHITYTPKECEFISYYAEKLLPVGADYKGKEECKNLVLEEDAILQNMEMPEQKIVQPVMKKKEETVDVLSSQEKKKLLQSVGGALNFE